MDTLTRVEDPWTRSQSFTVRVWYELIDADQWEVRVQTKHILSGETRYFREWALLAAYLTSKLDLPGVEGAQHVRSGN